MGSRAASPVCLTTIEQRFLRGPSLWSGKSCLVTLLDMGPLARALTTDFPGMGEQVLSLFPHLHDFAEPLRRGTFVAELLGRIALELQHGGGARPRARCALTVHGRQAQVRIIIAGQKQQIAVQAFGQAMAIVAALCAGQRWIAPVRSARPVRPACGEPALQFIHAHAGEHGQHEHQRLLAAAQ